MRYISLINLFVGLNDLLTKRLKALQSFAAGSASVKVLTGQRDSLGYALWHILEAYVAHPDPPPALIEAAKKIRAAFIPTLEDLIASYPAEAKAAMERKPALVNLKAELGMFSVASGGATLYDWTASFLTAGEKIDAC